MKTPLLQTKFHIPVTRLNLVSRGRLLEKLQQGTGHRLTLIAAPAGFGKTTIAANWLSELRTSDRKRYVCWLSVDEGDNERGRFLAYLVSAVNKDNVADDILEMIDAPQPASDDAILTSLINNLADANSSFTLVLDDYHLITNVEIHNAINFLIDNQPPNLHIILVTRTDPPLSLSRLRAQGLLTEIRARDLRFTVEEIKAFLDNAVLFDLSKEDILSLETRTEGWIAGIQMAALSMRDHANPSEFIEAFAGSHRYIFDYLTDEVLAQRPQGTQEFLLQTSILERMCAPLCNAVTGRADSQEILESLESSNLFIVPLDSNRGWYRYHQLFGDLLRQRLEAQFPKSIHLLHRKASEWLEREGIVSEAIDHSLAAGDHQHAVKMIEPLAHGMSHRYEVYTLDRWIKSLPEEMLFHHPAILYPYAVTLSLTNRFAEWEHYLNKAEQAARANRSLPESDSILGQALVMKCIRAFLFGDFPLALERHREAVDTLPELGMTAERWDLKSIHGYSTIQWNGDLDIGLPSLEESLTLSEKDEGSLGATLCYSFATNVHLLRGSLQEALVTAEHALASSTLENGSFLQGAVYPRALMGRIYYERDLLDDASSHLLASVQPLTTVTGMTTAPLDTVFTQVMLLQTQGEESDARAFVEEAIEHFENIPISPSFRDHLGAIQARLDLRQGNIDSASKWAESISEPAGTGQFHPVQGFTHLTWVRAQLVLGNHWGAEKFLALFGEWCKDRGLFGLVLEAELLQAVSQGSQGNTKQALEHMTHALELAAPQGYIRTFVDEGKPAKELLKRLKVKDENLNIHVRKIIAAFVGEKAKPAHSSQPSGLIEPLTDRELEILGLVADGLSNSEIARKLYITTGTTKRHVANIFLKLGVGNRTQAASLARKLNLI